MFPFSLPGIANPLKVGLIYLDKLITFLNLFKRVALASLFIVTAVTAVSEGPCQVPRMSRLSWGFCRSGFCGTSFTRVRFLSLPFLATVSCLGLVALSRELESTVFASLTRSWLASCDDVISRLVGSTATKLVTYHDSAFSVLFFDCFSLTLDSWLAGRASRDLFRFAFMYENVYGLEMVGWKSAAFRDVPFSSILTVNGVMSTSFCEHWWRRRLSSPWATISCSVRFGFVVSSSALPELVFFKPFLIVVTSSLVIGLTPYQCEPVPFSLLKSSLPSSCVVKLAGSEMAGSCWTLAVSCMLQ